MKTNKTQPKNAEERKETLPISHVEMANNANRMGYLSPDDPNVPKLTECPCGHEAFLRVAKPLPVLINGIEMTALPKRFRDKEGIPESEKSFGWGTNGQCAMKPEPCKKADWEQKQLPVKVSINGVERMLVPMVSGEGSCGWYLSDKIPTAAGDWVVMMQAGIGLWLNKSKLLADDAEIKGGWVNCTLGINLSVCNSKGR